MKGGPHPVGKSVAETIANEEKLGLHRAETFRQFGNGLMAQIMEPQAAQWRNRPLPRGDGSP